MIKVGDKLKGFRFSGHMLSYDPENYYGLEGTVTFVEQEYDRFMIEFEDDSKWGWTWWYPLSEYIKQQREEKLKELGI